MDITKVKGSDLKSDFEWLKFNGCGCCRHSIYDTDNNNMYILMGWHDTGDGWEIAVKIGMQSFNNAMQCDLDVDFDMPYDKETGDVYDTLQIVDENEDWEALAEQLNEEAVKVVEFQIEQEL
jgi:hypothetical protein